MPTTLSLVVAFVHILCGYAVTVRLLRWRNGVAVVAGSILLGPTALFVLGNLLGYFMPIARSILLVCVLTGLTGFAVLLSSLYREGKDAVFPKLEWPPRKILWGLLLLTFFAGAAFARDQGSDFWTWPHLALPASIVEGAFPVVEVSNPWHHINYHYGVPLLVAAFQMLSDIQLTTAHVFIPMLSAVGILLFTVALAFELSRSWRTAALCGVVALFGADLFWLQGWHLLADLWQHYVLQQPIGGEAGTTQWRWLTPSIRNTHSQALFMMLGHRPIAFGFALFMAFLYTLHTLLQSPDRRTAFVAVPACITVGLGVALTLETSFVVLTAVTGGWIAHLLWKRPERWRGTVGLLIGIFLPMGLLSLVQGGPLSQLHGETGPEQFEFMFDGTIRYGLYTDIIYLWEWRFFRDYGLHVALFILALLFVRRKRARHPFVHFLIILAVAHAVLPLFVRYLPYPTNMNRLFFAAYGIIGIPGGMAVADLLERRGRWVRAALITMLCAMFFAAAVHLPVRLFFPTLILKRTPLFPQMPALTQAQQELFSWVLGNTTQSDWFFIFDEKGNVPTVRDRLNFSSYTGRFPIGWGDDYFPTKEEERIFAGMALCKTEALDAMHIRYLAVLNERNAEWFSSQCADDAWEMRFQSADAADGVTTAVYERVGGAR